MELDVWSEVVPYYYIQGHFVYVCIYSIYMLKGKYMNTRMFLNVTKSNNHQEIMSSLETVREHCTHKNTSYLTHDFIPQLSNLGMDYSVASLNFLAFAVRLMKLFKHILGME